MSFEEQYRVISRTLSEYGLLASPRMLGGEWERLHAECAVLNGSTTPSDDERREIEHRVNRIMIDAAYHPNTRADYINHARGLPHIGGFSHWIERAAFQYYKRDYLSCAMCLIPSVEGVLRAYGGFSLEDRASGSELRDKLRAGRAKSYHERHALYAQALATFHERWFWTSSGNADFRLSRLNRHYALHGLGTEGFYRAVDCHRLFLFFDLFSEMLFCEGFGSPGPFISLENPDVKRRRDYYFDLIEGNPTLRESQEIECSLLAQHSSFVEDSDPPTLEKSLIEHIRSMAPLFADLIEAGDQ